MARAALRPRAAFRLRTAKPEESEKTGPTKKTRLSKKTGPSQTSASKKTATSKKTERKAQPKSGKAERGTRPNRDGRRPLFFPVRLLAMLLAFAFMVAFAVALARLTLEPSPASVALTHTNMHPGRSLRAYLDQPEMRDAIRQIGGNLLLGVPFGILVPVVAPRARGILRVLLLTAVVMLLVEFAQGALVTGRAFDIDDVILNTTGALIGYLLLGRRLSRVVHA